MTTDAEVETWVVISQTAWKGWRAYVDGEPTKIRRANHAFIAIYVPRGVHEVHLNYWPRSFTTGRAISAFTILLLVGFAVWRARARFMASAVTTRSFLFQRRRWRVP